MGKPGRKAFKSQLAQLTSQREFDLVIVNGENSAGGFGITPKIANELFASGAGVITSGNHVWDKRDALALLDDDSRVLRPLNYPPGVPGAGSVIVVTPSGKRVAVVNLAGRVFMPNTDCPFRAVEAELEKLDGKADVIVIDLHAEATSEKIAMGWFLDGKVGAVLGTHTHVQTSDERVLPAGTAYITDVGMTGPVNSVLGVRVDQILERFLLQMPNRYEVATGPVAFSAVEVELDGLTGMAASISRHYLIV